MEDASSRQLLTEGGAEKAGCAVGAEERVDRHPCDEGDKSLFYSLHCGNPKQRCLHCGQWVCPYHFEPNQEGVVGGHSNCRGASRGHARDAGLKRPSQESDAEDALAVRVSRPDADAEDAPLRPQRSSAFTKGLAYSFEALAFLMTLLVIAGIGYILFKRSRGGNGDAPVHGRGRAPTNEDQEKEEEIRWSWSSAPWCILAGLLILGCGGPSALFCSWQVRQALNKGIMPTCCPNFVKAGAEATERAMGTHLASESMLGGVVTLCGVVLGLCFVKEDGSAPIWLLPLVLPVVLRTKIIEVRLLPFYGGSFSLLPDLVPFVLSAFEVVDRYSDGITVAVMYASDAHIHAKWVNTFVRSPNPVVRSMAPLLSVIHLWHVSAFALAISTAQQAVLGMDTKGLRRLPTFGREQLAEPGYGPEAPQAAAGADLAGFGALAGRFEKRSAADGRQGIVKVALGFVKSLVENMPQGLLASVLLGLRGRPLTGNPVVCLSAITSTLSLAKQGASVVQGTFSISRAAYSEDPSSGLMMFAIVFPLGLSILVCSAYLATKLVMIQLCPEHAWSLAAGCIDLSRLE